MPHAFRPHPVALPPPLFRIDTGSAHPVDAAGRGPAAAVRDELRAYLARDRTIDDLRAWCTAAAADPLFTAHPTAHRARDRAALAITWYDAWRCYEEDVRGEVADVLAAPRMPPSLPEHPDLLTEICAELA